MSHRQFHHRQAAVVKCTGPWTGHPGLISNSNKIFVLRNAFVSFGSRELSSLWACECKQEVSYIEKPRVKWLSRPISAPPLTAVLPRGSLHRPGQCLVFDLCHTYLILNMLSSLGPWPLLFSVYVHFFATWAPYNHFITLPGCFSLVL